MALYLKGLSSLSLTSRFIRHEVPLVHRARYVTMKIRPVQKPPAQTYEEKNEKLKRPLSPHVDIYAMQLSTALSLSHRVSGVAITVYIILFAVGSVAMQSGGYWNLVDYVDNNDTNKMLLLAAKLALAVPIAFHWTTGTRHLYWDFTGNHLLKSNVQGVSYLTVIMWIVFTSILMALTLNERPPPPSLSDRCPPPYEKQ